jgi:hypothetical protein
MLLLLVFFVTKDLKSLVIKFCKKFKASGPLTTNPFLSKFETIIEEEGGLLVDEKYDLEVMADEYRKFKTRKEEEELDDDEQERSGKGVVVVVVVLI